MEGVELVIKIPEEKYDWIMRHLTLDINFRECKITSLPKGHGDLIDRNKIEYLKAIHDAKYGRITWSDAILRIKYSAPTIIEADKAGSEE